MTGNVIRDFRGDTDGDWVVARHAALYARDEGFDASFGELVRQIVTDFTNAHDPACEHGWIAEREGARAGSIFCVRQTADLAKLRLFLVEPEARGTGLAQGLLATCMGFARDAGYKGMTLWTHESHVAAGRLYARTGFTLERSVPARSFGVDVVEQHWQIAL